MLTERNRLYKRKIIGGSLLGNLFDAAKGVVTSGTKAALGKVGSVAKNILSTGATKALSTVKDLASTAIDKGKQFAIDKTHDLASKLGQKVVSAAQNVVKKAPVPTAVKEKITELAKSPAVKKVLTEKAKEIVRQSF